MNIDKNLEAILTQVASKIKKVEDVEKIDLLAELKLANEELTGRMLQFAQNKGDMNILAKKVYLEATA